MSAEATSTEPTRRRSGRNTFVLVLSVALVAAGLYAWNTYVRSIRYEIALDREQLFTGSLDTMRLVGVGVSRAGTRVPWSHPRIQAEIVDGATLGRLERDGAGLRFIAHGQREGEVQLRVSVEDWPFPMLVSFRILVPLAQAVTVPRDRPEGPMTIAASRPFPPIPSSRSML